jgi:hypothetical protein
LEGLKGEFPMVTERKPSVGKKAGRCYDSIILASMGFNTSSLANIDRRSANREIYSPGN